MQGKFWAKTEWVSDGGRGGQSSLFLPTQTEKSAVLTITDRLPENGSKKASRKRLALVQKIKETN